MSHLEHYTRPIKVWIDADAGIADFVEYLNAIPDVRTLASCQGTIGEGGANPYRAQVLVSWITPEAHRRLLSEFDVTFVEDCDNAFYVHPKESGGPQ